MAWCDYCDQITDHEFVHCPKAIEDHEFQVGWDLPLEPVVADGGEE